MIWTLIASGIPAGLLVLACVLGGVWPLLATLSITVVVFFADKIEKTVPPQETTGRSLSYFLAAVHFLLLGLGIWALGQAGARSTTETVLTYIALGLFFGQISNSNAHELIHAAGRWPRRTGALIYISLLHGHHVSAHLRVHHVHAATANDPNSAAKGEGFWAYAYRASKGEFWAGFRADQAQRARADQPVSALLHPYLWYVLGAASLLVLAFAIAGWTGVLAHLGLALYAQLQLLLSDYVQHYGLRRVIAASGKPEPMGPQHSWNTPKWYSGAMMLNAPRHSDHHLHPRRAFPNLRIAPDEMPMLPHSLPVMAVIALIPPLWRRVMDKRVTRWQAAA